MCSIDNFEVLIRLIEKKEKKDYLGHHLRRLLTAVLPKRYQLLCEIIRIEFRLRLLNHRNKYWIFFRELMIIVGSPEYG